MLHIHIHLADTDNSYSTMDESIVEISPAIDIIDLTKESPSESVKSSRSRQRITADVSSSHGITGSSDRCYKRHLSPLVLGNTQYTPTNLINLKKKRVSRATSSKKILTLNDSVKEDKTYYTVESDNREPVPLTCPICLELLTSNLKPITTRCGHLFCTECLKSIVRISKKCPTCKTAITLKSSTRLYL